MTFADLVAGDQVFVDANTLTYHFQPHPLWGPACTQLLERIKNQELAGFTSTHVLAELAHRLMTLEANTLLRWPIPGIGNRLRSHPTEVQKLALFRRAIDGMVQGNLQILIVTPPLLATAAALCQQIGLLTNDGLIVAVMQANGLTKLASHDADFDRVPGLTRYAPL
jgi:predicted nucleic acid-binding protein